MATKVTWNGVTYDGVDAMPADVRHAYDQALAQFPELADRDGDSVPDIVRSETLLVQPGATVRKRIIVNGTSYDDESAMPPDVRQAYETAKSALRSGGPAVIKSEIKFSFHMDGPGVHFHKDFGGAHPSPAIDPTAMSVSSPQSTPSPIQPDTMGAGIRVLIVAACAAVALLLWFLVRAR